MDTRNSNRIFSTFLNSFVYKYIMIMYINACRDIYTSSLCKRYIRKLLDRDTVQERL